MTLRHEVTRQEPEVGGGEVCVWGGGGGSDGYRAGHPGHYNMRKSPQTIK